MVGRKPRDQTTFALCYSFNGAMGVNPQEMTANGKSAKVHEEAKKKKKQKEKWLCLICRIKTAGSVLSENICSFLFMFSLSIK